MDNKKELKARVGNAIRAMKSMGISEAKVKPVLKKMLKLYDKNWALIEEENYRALADAIFEEEENEAKIRADQTLQCKKPRSMEEEAQETEELEIPLKRSRIRHQGDQCSDSEVARRSGPLMLLLNPKEEPDELPKTSLRDSNASHDMMEPHEINAENTSFESNYKRKGKELVSPPLSISPEGRQPIGIGKSHRSTRSMSGPRSLPVPVSPSYRGKRPASSQISSDVEKSVARDASRALCLSESNVGPVVLQSTQQNCTSINSLLKPKDEPITDDIPCLESPLAVIYPDLPNGRGLSNEHCTNRQHANIEPSVSPSLNETEAAEGTAPPNNPRDGGELPISAQHTSRLELASSPSGEVKIFLGADLSPGISQSNMPTLETVLGAMEEKFLRLYRNLEPKPSLINLMKEVCLGFIKSGSDLIAEPPANLNENPTALKKSPGKCDLDSAGFSLGSDNGLNGPASPKALLASPFCSDVGAGSCHPCIGDCSHQNRMNDVDNWRTNIVNAEKFGGGNNDLSRAVVQQTDVTPELTWLFYESVDITKGQEKVVISLVNEVNNECPPSFHYIPQSVVVKNARLNFPLARIGNKSCCPSCLGDCLSSSPPCACAHETGGEFAYTRHGLVKEELLDECISMHRDPKTRRQFLCKERSEDSDLVELCGGLVTRRFIKECWLKCGCDKQCGNRVIQRGITCKLQVFMTLEGKGWGLRTLEDLPKGSFVCEYAGEVLTCAELFDRSLQATKREKLSYPVLLDAYSSVDGAPKDEDALCLDAAYYGNVARFINHRCYDPNLVEIPVKVETIDHHYYHVALFTAREVKANEELTWDYGIDFGDIELPMQAFSCKCGSQFCRNLSRSRTRGAKR